MQIIFYKYITSYNTFLVCENKVNLKHIKKLCSKEFLSSDNLIFIDDKNNFLIFNNKGEKTNFSIDALNVLMHHYKINDTLVLNNQEIFLDYNNKVLSLDLPTTNINQNNNNTIIDLGNKNLFIHKKKLNKNLLINEAKLLSEKFKSNIGFFRINNKIILTTYKKNKGFVRNSGSNIIALAVYLNKTLKQNKFIIHTDGGKSNIEINNNKIFYKTDIKLILNGSIDIV